MANNEDDDNIVVGNMKCRDYDFVIEPRKISPHFSYPILSKNVSNSNPNPANINPKIGQCILDSFVYQQTLDTWMRNQSLFLKSLYFVQTSPNRNPHQQNNMMVSIVPHMNDPIPKSVTVDSTTYSPFAQFEHP